MKEIRREELQLFENQEIRSAWDDENEEWYFSIVDVVGVLIDAVDYKTARNYWKVTKHRMLEEGNELVTNCNQLKLKSPKDGKQYRTDVANTEQLLRIIQSIPSKKAEPFKLWLAKVGKDRLDEIADPEKAMERAVAIYKAKGYSEKYKELKGLKKENLRDNMTNTELALNLLAEVSTTELSRMQRPSGYAETKEVTISGGEIAGNARKELEAKLGRTVISSSNATMPELLDDSKKPVLHMIVEQTYKYPMRMEYDSEKNTFREREHKSLAYERNFTKPYGWIKESGTPPHPHWDCILMTDEEYDLGDEIAIKVIGVFKRSDLDHKYVVVEVTRDVDDFWQLRVEEKEELNRLYPRIREGEGWYGKEEAEYCMMHHQKAL